MDNMNIERRDSVGLLADLAGGLHHGVFIDDTGAPGAFSGTVVGGSGLTRVFVDEGSGFRRSGNYVTAPVKESGFVDGKICFARSSDVYPIQLADFAAYVLQRTQWIIAKTQPNELDRGFLQIVSPMARCFRNVPFGALTAEGTLSLGDDH